MTDSTSARHPRTRVVVVGNGMVGSRFVDDLLSRDGAGPGPDARFEITVLGAEAYEPYNRVLLSEVVAGKVEVASLALPALVHPRATAHRGVAAVRIDRAKRAVHAEDGSAHPYDVLVLATGSIARIPAITGLTVAPGRTAALPRGVHALRTLDDAREIVAATVNARRAVVIGAGVLGLEAACGLARRGLEVTVIHGGPSLMDRQLDTDAGAVAAATLTRLGVTQRLAAATSEILVEDGLVTGLLLTQPDGEHHLPVDLLVFTCGTVPEARIAADAGLPVDRGIVVDDSLCSPGDPRIFAIGDCAQPREGGTGLIAQGWDQSRRLADHLTASAARAAAETGGARVRLGGAQLNPGRPSMALRLSMNVITRAPGAAGGSPAPGTAPGAALGATADPNSVAAPAQQPPAQPTPEAPRGTDVVRLKAAGLDVVTMGVCGARRVPDPAHRTVRLTDPAAGRHVEVVVAGGFVVGATCVGAPQIGADLTAAYTRRTPVPADPAYLLLQPVASATTTASDPTHMPDRTTVCRCNSVTKASIVESWRGGARSVAEVAKATRATTGCGGCKDVVCGLVDWLAAADPAQDEESVDLTVALSTL